VLIFWLLFFFGGGYLLFIIEFHIREQFDNPCVVKAIGC